jgi:hypothetical protein
MQQEKATPATSKAHASTQTEPSAHTPRELQLRRLSPKHLAELRTQSGLDDATIIEGGWRTVTAFEANQQLGFLPEQCLHWQTALAMPLHHPDGSNGSWVIKPDQAYFETLPNGKKHHMKYIFPKGSKHQLDVRPADRERLLDPTVPLFFTEGGKKRAWLGQQGYLAANVWGVHDWYTQTDKQHPAFPSIRLIDDWEILLPTFDGRLVYICFDSDTSKFQVGLALRRLANKLTELGASVHVIHIPPAEDGSKQGVDDYGAREGAEAFARLVARAQPHVPDPTRRERLLATLDGVPERFLNGDEKVYARGLVRRPHARDGSMVVYRAEMADATGLGLAKLDRIQQRLTSLGLIRHTPITTRLVDDQGRVSFKNEGTRVTFTAGGPDAFLEQLAKLDSERPKRGGARPNSGPRLTPLVPAEPICPACGQPLAHVCDIQNANSTYEPAGDDAVVEEDTPGSFGDPAPAPMPTPRGGGVPNNAYSVRTLRSQFEQHTNTHTAVGDEDEAWLAVARPRCQGDEFCGNDPTEQSGYTYCAEHDPDALPF